MTSQTPPQGFHSIELVREAFPSDWIEPLSRCLAGTEPDRLEDFRAFWTDWASGRIPGRKVTVAAWEGGLPPPCADPRMALGVVRLWESPYCGDKWFIEGLEVVESHRRCGIATSMLATGIHRVCQIGVTALWAHVRDDNVASIRTLKKAGFAQVTDGSYVSSYGEPISGGSEYILDLSTPVTDLYGRFRGIDLLGELARSRAEEGPR